MVENLEEKLGISSMVLRDFIPVIGLVTHAWRTGNSRDPMYAGGRLLSFYNTLTILGIYRLIEAYIK